MALQYLPNGNIIPGIHVLTWGQFVQEFGYTNHRKQLIDGLKKALTILKKYNCQRIYVDGSFVTKKLDPGDWDACFDPTGMDLSKLYQDHPVFFDLVPPRLNQKNQFKGEIFLSTARADRAGNLFLHFFQKDRQSLPKGIVELSLQNYVL